MVALMIGAKSSAERNGMRGVFVFWFAFMAFIFLHNDEDERDMKAEP
jgi:hypothetical protein